MKIISDHQVFGRVFRGVFTETFSALLRALSFEEAWTKATRLCIDIEDIASPLLTDPVGKYTSRSGSVYLFSETDKYEYVIEFPDETSFDLMAVYESEVRKIGPYRVKLIEE